MVPAKSASPPAQLPSTSTNPVLYAQSQLLSTSANPVLYAPAQLPSTSANPVLYAQSQLPPTQTTKLDFASSISAPDHDLFMLLADAFMLPDLPELSALDDELYANLACMAISDPIEPRTYKQVKASAEASIWKASMAEEIDSMHDQRVWIVVPIPTDKNIVGSKWLYRIKRDENGDIFRY